MTIRRAPAVIVAALLALSVSPAFSFGVARADNLDPGLAARVRALAPHHVSDADVRETLAVFGAPRIIAIEGDSSRRRGGEPVSAARHTAED